MGATITTAGWSIPAPLADAFPGDGQHLARYARVMNGVEINSSFHRSHQHKTYVRWAEMTPPHFRFAVKLPRTITHQQKLRDAADPLSAFLGEVEGLGAKLGPVLVQLPPSLVFDAELAGDFFTLFRRLHAGAIVCEPRHASWFASDADALMTAHRIGRVAADPAPHPLAAEPGGWRGTVYFRLHGSPKTYWSAYGPERLREWHDRLDAHRGGADAWCVFDNTAAGAALENAMRFQEMESETERATAPAHAPPDKTRKARSEHLITRP